MERDSSYHYSFTDINRYISGGMSASEMHDIERAALQDPFLADAIEGYREADRKQSEKHLNEIVVALQTQKAESKVIPMPKKRGYAWLIASSLIAIIGSSIFLLTQSSNKKASNPLAQNKMRTEERRDTVSDRKTPPAVSLSQDSEVRVSESSSSPKQKTLANQPYKVEKKEVLSSRTATSQAAPAETATAVSPASGDVTGKEKDESEDDKSAAASEPSLALADTQNQPPQAASIFARRAKAAPGNTWTTDKGKPFVLSEVEEFQVGRKGKKITDTSAVKPEGGWQSFQEYLFSKLSKKDTAAFANAARFDGNLELEFSVTKNGLPYNVKVLQAQDSATAKTAAAAVQQGPKWISDSKTEKRLNIRY